MGKCTCVNEYFMYIAEGIVTHIYLHMTCILWLRSHCSLALSGWNWILFDECQHSYYVTVHLFLQEAKEDAEMDAEIALEMAMERQRRLSTTSNNSSGGGTYIGPCPHSPGQVANILPCSLVSRESWLTLKLHWKHKSGCNGKKVASVLYMSLERVLVCFWKKTQNVNSQRLSSVVSVSPCRRKRSSMKTKTCCR